VEACDPCEANNYGYQIQGTLVSDFITPHFYDSVETPGSPYSFTGAIKRPRQILPGGYISFVNLQQTNGSKFSGWILLLSYGISVRLPETPRACVNGHTVVWVRSTRSCTIGFANGLGPSSAAGRPATAARRCRGSSLEALSRRSQLMFSHIDGLENQPVGGSFTSFIH
jgi:hypothetical protein